MSRSPMDSIVPEHRGHPESPLVRPPERPTWCTRTKMIHNAIRNSESDHQIYSLFAGYIETLQSGVRSSGHSATQPISGINDLRSRFRQLMIELDATSSNAEDKSSVMKQALYIYGEALARLHALDEKKSIVTEQCSPEPSIIPSHRRMPDRMGASALS